MGDLKNGFADWLKGEGEGVFGQIIKSSAQKEKRRLRAIGEGGLFPHIDHETRDRIAKCEQAEDHGQKKIDRHARRSKTIDALRRTPGE